MVLFSIIADSRARLVAGSFQGYTGHVDGKPNEARFNHPRGVTMDDKGNVYVADTLNLAIRKIGDAGMHNLSTDNRLCISIISMNLFFSQLNYNQNCISMKAWKQF